MDLNRTPTRRFTTLQQQVAYDERLKRVMNLIHAAKDIDQILVALHDEMLSLFDAERSAIYAVDYDRKEVYSKFSDLNKIREIRVPLGNQSIVGFVATNCIIVNVTNAYDKAELARISPALAFDNSWDQRSGMRTRQVLTVPVCAPATNALTGVIQLINKRGAERFTPLDEQRVREVAQTLGIALHNQYQLLRRKSAKFDTLVTNNLLSQQELDLAITEARDKQRPLESILMETYQVRKHDIGNALSAFYRCPFFDPEEQLVLDRALLENLNLSYLKTHGWVPLHESDDEVEILIDDPTAFTKRQDIQRVFPARKIRYVVGLLDDIVAVLDTAHQERAAHAPVSAILGQLAAEEQQGGTISSDTALDENDSGLVRLVNQIIADAYKAGASGIHIEPHGPQREAMVRIRVDGRCEKSLEVPPQYRRPLASRLKVMAQLDIAERRKPQDGKIQFRLPDREIELRAATLPTAETDNEDVVLRILTAKEPIQLDNLGMSERNLQEFKRVLQKPYGMILCVGPTGSGKTTTLHSALAQLNMPDRKIWTAEDPVEITQYGLRQLQVHHRIGLDFATAMRSFLRADPDIIMVGEIRDRATAEISIEASLTGHLILSTLHTNSAVETVTRLLEMQMDPFLFADALLGVLAQRLTRTICRNCKEQYHPTKEEYDTLAYGYGEEAFAHLGIIYNDAFRLTRGKGCQACRHSGYKGRMGIHELLIATDEVKRLIHARAPVSDILAVALTQGMTTLVQDGIMKTLQGWTDYKQVQAVAMR
ncbi:MAG: GspE/PulE family protein [Deltaproteobacteria bacterium]|nr:GspE/PulE family protein [Deltaproteobacteria bacterium]